MSLVNKVDLKRGLLLKKGWKVSYNRDNKLLNLSAISYTWENISTFLKVLHQVTFLFLGA